MADEYADSTSVLIADADCTGTGSDLCTKYDVGGYPTIKYFVDGDTKGQDYQGGRDFDVLKTFVEETLEVKCDITNPAVGCSDKEKGYIEKMTSKSAEDRTKESERLEKMAGGSMKKELKTWLAQRRRILKQLDAKK